MLSPTSLTHRVQATQTSTSRMNPLFRRAPLLVARQRSKQITLPLY